MDRSLGMAEFGELYLAGKTAKTAERIVINEGIPHYRAPGVGTLLVKESDADLWRESKTRTSKEPTLKSLLTAIAAKTLAARQRKVNA